MTPPDFRRGYLRVPLTTWRDVFCRAPLTRRQLQIVALVIRESWGWQARGGEVRAWTRPLTPRHFAEATDLSTDHLRRDLADLLERGVLREAEGAYQFVADPQLWITPVPPAPLLRPAAPKRPDPGAVLAASPPGVKTMNKKGNRYRSSSAFAPGAAVDNPTPAGETGGLVVFDRRSGSVVAPAAERLTDVVAAFVGALSPDDAEALRVWICEDGIARVWQELEPAFRTAPLTARQRLLEALDRRAERRRQDLPEQEPDAAA